MKGSAPSGDYTQILRQMGTESNMLNQFTWKLAIKCIVCMSVCMCAFVQVGIEFRQ